MDDLNDTIARLQAFAAAGADVVFAPGLSATEQIRTVGQSVDAPVSMLAGEGVPPVSTLAQLGVRQVSVGGALAFAAYGALVHAANELLHDGTYGFLDDARTGSAITQATRRYD